MGKTTVAIELESRLLNEVDELVREQRFADRSAAIEAAVTRHLAPLRLTRLAAASTGLKPAEERALAEEGIAADADAWPRS